MREEVDFFSVARTIPFVARVREIGVYWGVEEVTPWFTPAKAYSVHLTKPPVSQIPRPP